MSEKTIGILGGMGPAATVDLFTKIVEGTKVKRDQDHLRVLIDNNPKIPDRTLAIQGKASTPLTEMVRSAKILENAGADFIVIPCVTAHYYYDSLQKRIKIPILHVVEETMKYIEKKMKGMGRIGLIATEGTIHTGLFQKAFSNNAMELILPTPEVQRKWVTEAIYGKRGIKAVGPSEHSKRFIREASESLIKQGAQAIIAGCTEVPLVLKGGDLPIPVIDPISVLASAAVGKAQGKKGNSVL
jgi:aspartate racemase